MRKQIEDRMRRYLERRRSQETAVATMREFTEVETLDEIVGTGHIHILTLEGGRKFFIKVHLPSAGWELGGLMVPRQPTTPQEAMRAIAHTLLEIEPDLSEHLPSAGEWVVANRDALEWLSQEHPAEV